VKLKDKPTADALATWYTVVAQHQAILAGPEDTSVVKGPGPVAGRIGCTSAAVGWEAVGTAGLDLVKTAAPDPPEPLAEWLAAAQASEAHAYTEAYADAVFRFTRAQHALRQACAEGVFVHGN
jgi:hypothetical protein